MRCIWRQGTLLSNDTRKVWRFYLVLQLYTNLETALRLLLRPALATTEMRCAGGLLTRLLIQEQVYFSGYI